MDAMINGSRIRKITFYALIWIILAVCFAGQGYVDYALRGARAWWPGLFLWEGISWTIWGILALLVLHLTRRYPLDRRTWIRNLPFYLVTALVVAMAHLLLTVTLDWLVMQILRPAYGSLSESLQTNFFARITWRLFVFTIIVIACYAWESQRKYRSEQHKRSELQAQLMEAQLVALKMQLHPHFLFNTLHSLSELIHKDLAAADELVVRLGDFLRITLQESAPAEIPLRKELEFLSCYLEIEKIRLQDRLEICMEIEPATLNLRLPNLILQPIVENAVRHGIAPRSAGGRLEIRASRVDSHLRIEVQDDGPGFSSASQTAGVGLSNTRARLEKMYGAKQHIFLNHPPEGGLIVTIEIPAQEART